MVNYIRLVITIVCLLAMLCVANACKWAHLAMNGQNPHLTETYTDDDLGKFENLQAFEDFYSGHDTEHVPYHRPENILPVKSNADL